MKNRLQRFATGFLLRVGRPILPIACVASALACDPRDVGRCRDEYLQVHAMVSSVDTTQLEKVEHTLTAVQATLAVCESANQSEEVKQLRKARGKLQSHQSYLRMQLHQKPLTEQQLLELLKKGDDSCPQGQLYQYQESGRKVRCIGPQIVDMNWLQAEKYFRSRGYRITKQESRLRAEFGSESYNYLFSRPDDTSVSRCLTVFAAPGVAWQEVVSRVTGASPQSVKLSQPVKTDSRRIALGLIDDPTQAIVSLGDCEK